MCSFTHFQLASSNLIRPCEVRRRRVILTTTRNEIHCTVRRRIFFGNPIIAVDFSFFFKLFIEFVINGDKFSIGLYDQLLIFYGKIVFEVIEVILDQLLFLAGFLCKAID